MGRRHFFLWVVLISAGMVLAATDVTLTGTVTKTAGGPLKDVAITLAGVSGITATTDSAGKFTLTTVRALHMKSPQAGQLEFLLRGRTVMFSLAAGTISGNVAVFDGNGRQMVSMDFSDLNPGTQHITLPSFAPGLNIVRVLINKKTFTCTVLRLGNDLYLRNEGSKATADNGFRLAKRADDESVDTLIAKKVGYTDKKTPVASYTQSNISISMDSAGSNVCVVPDLGNFADFPEIQELPDPFKMMDGTRMTSKEQWRCRREEIKAYAQKCIYGWKPPKPDAMTASYSNDKLKITCTVGSVTKDFSVSISGNSGEGPYGAIIIVGGMATYGVPSGVATINYSQWDVAKSDVDGRDPPAGMFYDLYPGYKSTGSLMAWAWGISRMIDALELPEIKAQVKIDPKRIGVTGCSFAGKAAFAIAVWDERVALSLPVESGAGGVAAWRIAEEFAPPGKPQYPASGAQDGCQYLYETYDESTWLGDSINMFRKKEFTLPIDMHEVGALLAPRGFLGLGYSTKWICAQGEWGMALGMHMVYDALGYPDNMGMLIGKAGSHCSKSSALDEQAVYNAFVKKFLLGDSTANTSPSVGLRNDAGYPMTDAKYIPWTKPELSGEYPPATYDKE